MTDAEFALWKYDAENSMAHLHFEINHLQHQVEKLEAEISQTDHLKDQVSTQKEMIIILNNHLIALTAAAKRVSSFATFDPACSIPTGYWAAINALSDTVDKLAG